MQGADAAPHGQYPALRKRMPNALSAFQDSFGEGRAGYVSLPCVFISYALTECCRRPESCWASGDLLLV